MTCTILIAYTGDDWKELAALVLPNIAEYSARHGYSLQVHCGTYGDPKWAYPMQKTQWVRDVVDSGISDWYWVLDIDLLITNLRIPVLDFIDDSNAIYITKDTGGLNSGSYLVNNCNMARDWLKSIIGLRAESTSEQHAIQQLHQSIGLPFRDFTRVLPHPSINSIGYEHYPELLGVPRELGNWQQGDLVLHLPGKTPQDRVRILKEYLPRVIR